MNDHRVQNNSLLRSNSLDTADPVASVFYKPQDASLPESRLDFLQRVIDASASHVAVLDETGRIISVNRAWRHFAAETGLLETEYGLGCMYPELCTGTVAASIADRIIINDGIRQIIENREIEFRTEYRCTAAAEPLWFSIHAAAFQLPGNINRPMILVSHDDVSSGRLASDALKKDEERLRRLLATTNILPWEANAESWMFTYVGDQAFGLLGYPVEQWFDSDFWSSHIHPQDRDRAIAECTDLSQRFDKYQFEYRMIAKDGRTVWIHDMVSVVRENAKPTMIRGFMIDITERKQSEELLAELGGRLITAQEEERKRIARELHDDLNQRIALMSIELEQVVQLLPVGNNGLASRVRRIQSNAQDLSTEIHRMSYKLHPSKLDHLGLASALNSFCKEISESRGLHIDFRNNGIPTTLPRDLTLCIFRIAQEALQNVAKHSGASRADVFLAQTDDSISLVVADAGRGFDTSSGKMTKGLGFISMRERLRLVDGKMKVISKESHGTRIEISVPLHNLSSAKSALLSRKNHDWDRRAGRISQ